MSRNFFKNITIVTALAFGAFLTPEKQVTAQSSNEPSFQSEPSGRPTDRIIIKYKSEPVSGDRVTPMEAQQESQITRLEAEAGVELEYARQLSSDENTHVLQLPERLPEDQVEAISAELMTLPEVEYAEPDRIKFPVLDPDDTDYLDNQWHYFETWGINAPTAWDLTTGSSDVVVAVIDTGVTNHADLNDRLVGGDDLLLPGYDFIDWDYEEGGVYYYLTANDGNGRDSDASDPGNWISSAENSDVDGIFYGCGESNSSWHGTHVAGTIGAESDNNQGVAGVDWNAKILPVRVLGKCGGYTSDIVDGMRWAAGLTVAGVPANANPAKVLNVSLGSADACSMIEQDAIDDITTAGAVVVAAAGNNGLDIGVDDYSPANCDGVITVASTDRNGDRSSFSNYGSTVEISAPGGGNGWGGIYSTSNTGLTVPAGDTYVSKQGTSMSAPHVSGVLSLMFAVRPDMTPAQALQILQSTAKAFPYLGTCDTLNCGAGIANAGAAVKEAAYPDLIIATVTDDFQIGLEGGVYTITVENIGTDIQTGDVTVTIDLPDVSLIPVEIIGTGWTCDALPTDPIECTQTADLGPGESYPPIVLTIDVEDDVPNSFNTQFSVSGVGEPAVNTGNNTLDHATPVKKSDLIVVSASSSAAYIVPEEPFNINTIVKNQGVTLTQSYAVAYVFIDKIPDVDFPVEDGCVVFTGLDADWTDGFADYYSVQDYNVQLGPDIDTPISVPIYAGLSAGLHDIYVYVDAGCINNESNEDNNTYGPITLNVGAPAAFSKAAPSNTATGVGLSPTLSWAASLGATGYQYCYSSAPNSCSNWVSVGNVTSVALSGLAPNYTYYWHVRATNPLDTTEANGGTWWSFSTQTASACTWPPYNAPVSPTFADVPMNVSFWSMVERLYNGGITAGCGSGNFCPGNVVNRASMAIFLLRGKHCGSSYTPPPVGGSTGFNDVPTDAIFAPWVKQLAAEGVTAGCGNSNFCPGNAVNRASMAIFLLRAKHGGTYSPPATGGVSGFNDVPADASFAPWVKQLAAEGVTAGCGNGNFCPAAEVNRAQMAIFLVRNFGLP